MTNAAGMVDTGPKEEVKSIACSHRLHLLGTLAKQLKPGAYEVLTSSIMDQKTKTKVPVLCKQQAQGRSTRVEAVLEAGIAKQL